MKKRYMALSAILIISVVFVSCERTQQMLKPVADDTTPTDEMMEMLTITEAHHAWAHVMLPVPGALDTAADASETGEVHGKGSRTVYINAVGAAANQAGTPYPAGTIIVKEIMDDTNTFVAKTATMLKSDDPMYAAHNGWIYKKYARASASVAYMQVKGSNLEDAANGCHGCHVRAENDSVFVSLSMDTAVMPEAISIGVIVAETGQYVQAYGASMRQGFALARDEINATQPSHPLNLVVVDDRSTLEGTVAAVEQLVAQDVPAIVGVAVSTHLKAAFPIAQENGVVAFSSLSAAAGLSSIGDYVFRVGLATDRLLPAGVTATHAKLGYENPAAIYDAIDVYSTSSHAEMKKALAAVGLTSVIEETFETGDTDFTQQLTRIKDQKADALFISALSLETSEILRQARALGITAAIILPDLGVVEIQKAGAAAEGVITFTGWSPDAQTPGNAAFIENYMATYGQAPDAWAAQSYATLYILNTAIENAAATDAAAIRDALAETLAVPTILGDFSFDTNGEAVYDPILQIARDGELQILE